MRPAADPKIGAKLPPKFCPPEAGQEILVAVSGGVDSIVLLHILKKLSAGQRWKLSVAHFNHRLRGHASDSDEAFVRKTAAAMKLPFIADGSDVKKFAKGSRLSIEMAARKLRHEFLAKVARERKIKVVTLAHHADDQVELFFLRLLRGAGSGGLAGMKRLSPSPVDKTLSLVRPLLECAKAELEQYARDNKIRYREDLTNFSTDYLRNRVRNELLPLLRRDYQPALDRTIWRVMEIVGAEAEFVSETSRNWTPEKGTPFEKLPVAIQREILKGQLIKLGFSADFDLVESLRRAADKPAAVIASLSISRDKAGRVGVKEQHTPKFNADQFDITLGKSGRVIFDNVKLGWRMDKLRKVSFPSNSLKAGMECFDADRIGEKITLRHWHAGDRFQPIGFKAATKLQDLFVNQKIRRGQRHRLVLAESGGEIFWVEGLRIAENFKLTPQTRRVLVWQWRR